MRFVIAFLLVSSLSGCWLGSNATAPGIPVTAPPAGAPFVEPPVVASSRGVAAFRLDAATGEDGFPAFVYHGSFGEPTIRVNPGDTIKIDLHDELAGTGMVSDVNLHFHGLGVSPKRPSDDVLTMLATPGQTLHYVVHVPLTQPPGLYWYHPHVHGETEVQVGLGGMSGAIVVGGIEKYYPELANLPEQVLIVREVGDAGGVVRRRSALAIPRAPCTPFLKDWLTINDRPYPAMAFTPGKPTFFGILNASGDRTLDLAIDGAAMHVVAIDGFPVATYAPGPSTLTVRDFVLPPAGRVEFLATMTAPTALRTRCFDSGPAGDPDPEQLLVHLTPATNGSARVRAALTDEPVRPSASRPASLPPPAAHRIVNLSENPAGTQFFINGQSFDPTAPPMFVVHTGTVERWTVYNHTNEMHDFHLHQTHFLVLSIDGVPVRNPTWRDTIVVPWQTQQSNGSYVPGQVELIADFRNPVIRGVFLFHCHILNHEDNGMMAKIQAL